MQNRTQNLLQPLMRVSSESIKLMNIDLFLSFIHISNYLCQLVNSLENMLYTANIQLHATKKIVLLRFSNKIKSFLP